MGTPLFAFRRFAAACPHQLCFQAATASARSPIPPTSTSGKSPKGCAIVSVNNYVSDEQVAIPILAMDPEDYQRQAALISRVRAVPLTAQLSPDAPDSGMCRDLRDAGRDHLRVP